MRFSAYFDCILNEKKWFFSYRNNDISCTHARGHATLRENFEKMCNLMCLGEYFLSDFVLKLFFLSALFV